jgi:hypothetical protein
MMRAEHDKISKISGGIRIHHHNDAWNDHAEYLVAECKHQFFGQQRPIPRSCRAMPQDFCCHLGTRNTAQPHTLFAGHRRRQIGWDVDIIERSAHDLDSRGGGIVLRPEVIFWSATTDEIQPWPTRHQ